MPEMKNTRRDFLKIAGFAAASLAAGPLAGAAKTEAKKPNIILFLTDDQGWADTSVQMMADRPDTKSDFFRTPALARLAAEGMIFSNAYSPAPVCSPTRDSVVYGRTPARLHHSVLLGKARVRDDDPTTPRAVKGADPRYVTAHFGKWACSPRSPEDVGFDVSDGRTDNWHGDWQKVDGQKQPLPADDPKRIFSVTKRAGDFMAAQVKAGRPFYMQISHYAAHVQHSALAATVEKYRKLPRGRKCQANDYATPPPARNAWIMLYAAMIENLDTGLKMLLDKIDELGIAGNTYVLFTSDNGGGFRGNTPLRGGKASLWEGGIRVPTVVRGPGIKPGSRCAVPVAGWDFLPTFHDLAGGRAPLGDTIDGGTLRPLFENGGKGTVKRPVEGLMFHYPWFDAVPMSAVRLGGYKLVKDLNTGKSRLFNVAEDVGETKDLSKSLPAKAADLDNRLTAYLKQVDAETIGDLRAWREKTLHANMARHEKEILVLRQQLTKARGEKEKQDLQRRIKDRQRHITNDKAALQRVARARRLTVGSDLD